MIKTKKSFYYFSTFLVLILFSLILEGSLSINAKADSNKVSVNNIEELNNAWSNPNINYINIERDIDSNSLISQELKDRSAGDITVNANNHEINLGKSSFNVSQNKKDTTIYNASFENFKSLIGALGLKSTGIINDNKTTNWNYNFSNITVPEIGNSITSSISNFISAPTSQVNFSGQNRINTFDENVICGGFTLEKNSSYKGFKNELGSKSPFVNFISKKTIGTGDNNVNLKENSYFICNRPNESNGHYAAIYNYFNNLNIENGASFVSNISSVGYHNSRLSSNVLIGENSTFLINSNYGYPFHLSNKHRTNFKAEKGSNIFAKSKTAKYIFYGEDGSELSTFIADSPTRLVFDSPEAKYARIIQDKIKLFQINNFDASFWKYNSDANDLPTYSENDIDYYKQIEDDEISSSSKFLKKYSLGKLRKIDLQGTGTSSTSMELDVQNPYEKDFDQLTNADKRIRLRVLMKKDPIEINDDGSVVYKKVYAKKDEGTVKIIKPDNDEVTLKTDDDGFINYYNNDKFLNYRDFYKFNLEDSEGNCIKQISKQVIDKTPPDLIELDKNQINNSDEKISGFNAEKNINIKLFVNNKLTHTTTSNEFGKWSFNVHDELKTGDKINFISVDKNGNANPIEKDLDYHDAKFHKSKDYYVTKNFGPTSPKDPTNPNKDAETPENDGTKNTGELRLDYTPSSIDFENAKVPFSKKNIYANKKFSTNQQWVQVSDDRPDKDSGWELNVKQLEPFKDDDNNVIKGTILKIPKGTINSTNSNYKDNSLKSYGVELSGDSSNEQTIFSASKSNIKDNTTSVNYWPADKVNLSLLPSTVKPDKKYKTTLEWNLTKEAE